MRKIYLVAAREFGQRVRTRGFILSALLTPLILLVVWATGSFGADGPGADEPLADLQEQTATVGYVDEAELIQRTPPGLPETIYRPFASVSAADEALAAGEIEAYYLIPADYRESGDVRHIREELPTGPPDTALFEMLLRANMLPEADPAALARAQNPFQSAGLTVESVSAEAAAEADGDLNMMPFLVSMLIMVPLFTSGSYLLYSLTEEKGNRVMEILLVSLRPRALLVGKLLGLGALTAVQYLVWIVLAGGAFFLLGQELTVVSETIDLTAAELLLVFLYAVGGYALYATLMAGLGALAPDMEAVRSWVFIITLPMLIPVYLWLILVNAPGSPLAIALSLIPFSAPIAMLLRLTSGTVPLWQVVASLVLLAATAAFMVWLMARLFRVQTLLSGESFSVGRFWRVLRQA